MKNKSGILIVALALSSLASPALGQSIRTEIRQQPAAPATIERAECSVGQNGEVGCKATLRVTSGDATAFAIGVRFVRPDGKATTGEHIADRGIRPTAAPLRASEFVDLDFPFFVRYSPSELSHVELFLIFVQPSVGKPWGDTKTRAYQQMTNMRHGYAQAMAFLKSVYASQGADGVLREIQVKP